MRPAALKRRHQADMEDEARQLAEAPGCELAGPLRQLGAAHRPCGPFEQLALVLHCLMVDSGFLAVDATETAVQAAEAAGAAPGAVFALPSSAAEQLGPTRGRGSVAIAYAYGRQRGLGRCALLKVVSAGSLAVCHCGVSGSPGEPPELCASAQFNVDRHVVGNGEGGVRVSGLRALTVAFKNRIAEAARAAVHEARGLPPPGLAGLPPELLLRLLRACDAATVCRLAQANRRLRELCADPALWRGLLRRQFGGSDICQQVRTAEIQDLCVDYREAFKAAHRERTRLLRAVARRGSRELLLSPEVRGQLVSRGRAGGGRYSLNLLNNTAGRPRADSSVPYRPGGGGGGSEGGGGGSEGGGAIVAFWEPDRPPL